MARGGLHIALWVAQAALGTAFAVAGVMKLTMPLDELGKQMPWVLDMPGLVRFIGGSELAGALGLILPAATRILPWLTPLAAAGLALVMVLAGGYHASKGELQALPVNAALGGLALFIAWGRAKKARIEPRS